MEESMQNAAAMPMRGDRPDRETRREEITDMRKHELIMFAEQIVADVKKANIRGRERCFVNNVVNLLLDS